MMFNQRMGSSTPDFSDPWIIIAVLSNIVTLLGTTQWFKRGLKNKDSLIERQKLALDEMETDRNVWTAKFKELRKRLPEAVIEEVQEELDDSNRGLANQAVADWEKREGKDISRLLLFRAEWANQHAARNDRARGLLAAELYSTASLLFDVGNESAEALRTRVTRVRREEGERSPSFAEALSLNAQDSFDEDAVLAANEAEAEAEHQLRLNRPDLALSKAEAALKLRLKTVAPTAVPTLKTRRLKAQILMSLGKFKASLRPVVSRSPE
jgi:hypothetical protein